LVEEPKFSHLSRNLMLTMAANGRIGDAPKVIAAFEGTFLELGCSSPSVDVSTSY
jgi:F0F1-type ATP synthase delta subunit